MPEKNDINRVQAPIDIAMKMFQEQGDAVLRSILGPPVRERRTLIDGQPAEVIIEEAAQSLDLLQLLQPKDL